ncbi:MAG: DUF4249 family protein [Bacteroidota bacterium]
MKRIFYLGILILISSCDLYQQDDYQERYVVESYLTAQQPLPEVRLSTTAPVDEAYQFENETVDNAQVQVSYTGNLTDPAETVAYQLQEPGIYEPTSNHSVKPLGRYKLEITFPNSSDRIEAYTVVPDTFRSVSTNRDTVVYQSTDQIVINTTPSFYPNRQSIFVFNIISLDPVEDNLTPFYADAVDGDATVDEFESNSSGIINEENYDRNPDGTLSLRIPWLGVAFYEDNLLVANAIDDNLYDFIRSQSVQLGGSTQSPGEIQNVIYNIEGGIGVFGSIAADTVQAYIRRPPGF